MKRQLFYFFLFMCLAFPLNTTAQVVDIPDPNLRAAIESRLGVASGATITTADMATLTHLEAKNVNISDLTGLEGATKLTRLDLGDNAIRDISVLAGLTNLTDLGLNSNSISDLSPLRGLTNLKWMRLAENNITDLSPLVANTGLGSGDWIDVKENPLNRTSIKTHIPVLQSRGVAVEFDNIITEPFNILDPNLFTAIANALGKTSDDLISAADMANLTELTARNSNITDLTGLEHATNLKSLWLDGEEVRPGVWSNSNSVSDLSPLVGLTQLEGLDLWQNSVSDISAVAGLTNLTHLGLVGNDISDVSALVGLTNLTSLFLDGNAISDISAVADLTNLTRLGLEDNTISNLSPLSGLTHLTWLRLPHNSIADISALVGLTHLTTLLLTGNNISDISPLSGLTHLTKLHLHRNNISDISAISGLTHLTELRLERNNISDISSLVANTGLGSGDTVNVKENPLNYASIKTHILALQSREVAVEFDDVVAEPVNIPDPNLRAAIENALGKGPGSIITTADMANLTELFAYDTNIGNLTGLEFATNLTRLGLHNNSISDISAVADLTQLTTLLLSGNNISDISPVAGLTNLTYLTISRNFITNISHLSGLTQLTRLGFWGNTISDISPLVGLTNLTYLWIYNNLISDLSPLVANTGLGDGDTIDVWGNPLSDASIQTHIPALQSRGATVEFIQIPTTLLKISGTVTELDNLLIAEVRDNRNRPHEGVTVTFTVISGGGTLSVTNATTDANGRAESRLTLGPDTGTNRVSASVEGISELVTFSDVPELPVTIPDPNLRAAIERTLGKASGDPITASDMARLTDLFAPNSDISDLTGLEAATNLTFLGLGSELVEAEGRFINSNSVSDLSPLAGLTNLEFLILDSNTISDISAVAGLTNLESLNLRDNSISDISPVAGLTNLTDLSLGSNSISDLSPVAGLTNLTWLSLGGNSISDISPVAGLTNLTWLSLGGNSISDISPVAGLTNLTFLGLDNNAISDISAVAGLTNLTFLNLDNNTISDISAIAGLTNLTGLNLGDNSISDISAVAGLTNLRFLILADNSIVDLSPLVENMGLGEEDWVDVQRNPLSFLSIYTHIPALRSRGAGVGFDRQVPVLSGHTAPVETVAFSRDGTLASGGRNGSVTLWADESVTTLTVHTASARSVAFSPDGSILASGSHDGTVILWDTATEQLNILTEHTAPVETVAFSRDGSTLASGSQDGTVILWDVDTGQPKDTIMGHANWVWSVAFSPDGTLAIGRNDGTVLLWDVATGQPKDTLTGHTAWVESVAFTRDGSMLASGSGDNTVILWEVATGRPIAILPGHTAGVNSVAFSPDGTMLASGSDDTTVRLWDAIIGEPIATLTGHTSWVRSVAFSPDGTTLASGSGDTTVRLWEIAPPPLEYTLSIPADYNLIHVPLKVTAVDGVPQTITSIGDLYDALGGANAVKLLLTLDSHTQEWFVYFGPPAKGTPADRELTDDMGILAEMKTSVQVRLTGTPLGTNGSSTITLNPGYNFVGLPLNDSRLTHVSDLFTLEGIGGNAPVVIFTDNGAFKAVVPAGGPDDIPIIGGQAFFLDAQEAATVAISGVGWSNTSGTAAAPLLSLKGIEVRDTTLVLGLSGSIVDGETGLKVEGFRVTVKNLSTGKAVTAVTGHDETDYQLTVVDIETRRAATIGDILEISARSPNSFIGVKPLRYTVTAEDVKRSLIQLPELVTYEIPTETELLHNYPNPFNPETWIPYRLAEDAFVTLTIYDLNGQVVRTLDVGHQIAAVYESRSKAVYWDGRNGLGEQVASGVYFYHLSAGNYSATRKMLIIK